MNSESPSGDFGIVPDGGVHAQHRPGSVSDGRKFIVFSVDGERFAVDSQTVSEVIRDLVPTPLSRTPSWLLGIANLRGEIVTVVDLQKVLGLKDDGSEGVPKHIVVRVETKEALIALRIQKLSEMVTVAHNSVSKISGDNQPFFSGSFSHNGSEVTILNVGRLVDALTLT